MGVIISSPKLERTMTTQNRSAYGCLLAAWLIGQSCWAAYLPLIGPGPLRFQPAPSERPEPDHLAPKGLPVANTSTNQPAPPVSTELPDKIHHAEPIVTTASSGAPLMNPEPGGESLADQLMPPLFPAENELVTPQMMLYFFRRPPGQTATSVVGMASPLVFTPPVSAPLPSQSSYTTP